jgi:hypothetical protein
MKILLMLTGAVLICLTSCTKIDYIGKEYPPTDDVEVFFSLDDVEQPYEIMGHVIATADDIVSGASMNASLLEEARKKGADAVVVFGFDRYISGETTTHTESAETREGLSGVEATRTSETETRVDEKKEIKGVLIKYKNP